MPDGIHLAVGVWAGNITWYQGASPVWDWAWSPLVDSHREPVPYGTGHCHPLSIPIGVPNGGFNGRCFVRVSYVLVFIYMLAFCAKSSRV